MFHTVARQEMKLTGDINIVTLICKL